MSGFDANLGFSVSVSDVEDTHSSITSGNMKLETPPFALKPSLRQPLAPSFTLPGFVWKVISKRELVARSDPHTAADAFNSSDDNSCMDETIIIETTDDVSLYIGFSSGKSNMVWLEECGHGLGDRKGPLKETSAVLTVKSVSPRTLEVTGRYGFTLVEAGLPKMCLRTNLVPCQLAPSAVIIHGPKEAPVVHQPCSVELTAAKVNVVKGHPTLLYGLLGLSDGCVQVVSSDMDVR